MSKSNRIQLSDHFTTGRLLKFTASPIIMMIFTSIYTIVDGFFVSNYAGKTAFTRGLASSLGVTEPVTSPTYTIVDEYLSGRLPLFHFDMYRLGSADELFDIGWEDYLARGGICAVEWSEGVLF